MGLDHNLIRSNPFFNTLSAKNVSQLTQHIEIIKLQAKEILFHEGDFSDAFYIVKSGAIRITTLDSQGNTIFLARVADGNFFGETAFSLASSPRRRATATAQVESILYKFPRNNLLLLTNEEKDIHKFLHEQDIQYLTQKLNKLAEYIRESSINIDDMMGDKIDYPKRTIVYYQNDKADRAFIVINGEIELRCYDQNKQIIQQINIGQGQLFGIESFDDNKSYTTLAIAKEASEVICIDPQKYRKILASSPLLKELGAAFNNQFPFKAKGKILQFRSEYFDMPAITSIISLNDSREVICQKAISANIFLASLSNIKPDQTIRYKLDQDNSREISLATNKVIGVLDYGLWDDSASMLDLIVDGIILTDDQIKEFNKTGKIKTARGETAQEQEIVCKCMRVTRDTINQLIQNNKSDFADICQKTGAGTVCGGCRPTILEMLGTDAWTPCIIENVITHNTEIMSFQIKPLNRSVSTFEPGQYIIIRAKINELLVQRCYTLTSSPDQSYYEITVKKEANGLFSPWLFDHRNNKTIIYVAGPYGQFTLSSAQQKPIICFMGGIGITPAIAFIRHLIKKFPDQHCYIDYSVRHADQFIFNDELNEIMKTNPNIVVNHRITSIAGSLKEEQIMKIISSISDCHVFMCGPKGLENLVISTFRKMDLDTKRLHVEEFIHSGAPDNISQTISLD